MCSVCWLERIEFLQQPVCGLGDGGTKSPVELKVQVPVSVSCFAVNCCRQGTIRMMSDLRIQESQLIFRFYFICEVYRGLNGNQVVVEKL